MTGNMGAKNIPSLHTAKHTGLQITLALTAADACSAKLVHMVKTSLRLSRVLILCFTILCNCRQAHLPDAWEQNMPSTKMSNVLTENNMVKMVGHTSSISIIILHTLLPPHPTPPPQSHTYWHQSSCQQGCRCAFKSAQ